MRRLSQNCGWGRCCRSQIPCMLHARRGDADVALNRRGRSLRDLVTPVSRGLAFSDFVANNASFSSWRDRSSHPGVWCNTIVTFAVKLLLSTAAARGLLWLGRRTPTRLSAARLCWPDKAPHVACADGAALLPGAYPPTSHSAICQLDIAAGLQQLAGSHLEASPPSKPDCAKPRAHELAAVHVDTPPRDAAVQQL